MYAGLYHAVSISKPDTIIVQLQGRKSEFQKMKVCFRSFVYLSDECRAIFGAINIAVILIAFTGNLVALVVILKTKYFRNLSTCFLASLMMTDLLVGIIVAPMNVAQLVSEQFRNNCMLNNARRYLLAFLVGASVSSIVLISYDRYLRLTKAQNYAQFLSKRKVTALIAIAWVPNAVGPMIIILGKKDWIQYGISFVHVSLCLVLMVACYTCIIKTVNKKVKEIATSQAQDRIQQRRINNDIRAAKIIMIIIVCFVVTIIPSATYLCIVGITGFLTNGIPGFKEASMEVYYTAVMTLAMANSGINPLIYYLRNPKFKESLRKGFEKVLHIK